MYTPNIYRKHTIVFLRKYHRKTPRDLRWGGRGRIEMKGPNRTARRLILYIIYRSCECLPFSARVPRNATYVRRALLCCGATCCLEFCFVLALFVASIAFVCPFALSGPFSLFVFLVMSSVEGGRDAGFLPVFSLVFLSLLDDLCFIFFCSCG